VSAPSSNASAPTRRRATLLQLALSIPELGIAWLLGLAVFWAATAIGCRVASPICDSTGGVAVVLVAIGAGIVIGCGYWILALVLGLRGHRQTRYAIDAVVATVALGYIGALYWQANRSEAAARAASETARRDAAAARAKWIAELRQNPTTHGPPGAVPPMLLVNDAARDVEVTNTTGEWLVVALARVRPGNQGDWLACPLLTVGEVSEYYRFSIGPGHTTRYAPVPACAAEFEGAQLEFRVGDPYSSVGWWSDSAFEAPDDRLR
jgi:hypothetical protein